LIDLREDGSFLLNMEYFDYATGLTMCVDDRWERLFGVAKRPSESLLTQDHMDLALACQQVTEEVVLRLAETAKELTGSANLVMAGGVALNCVANGKLIQRGTFDHIWVQPAAGDAGGAVGAALAAWHIWKGRDRKPPSSPDAMSGTYLGPEFGALRILRTARTFGAPFVRHDDFGELCETVARLLADGKVVGWFQGRMEYGPRALGNRSILGDPRHPEMQKRMNLKIKYREGFRPFAPSVLEEDSTEFFELASTSPYMLIVAPVKENRRHALPVGFHELELYERLYHNRSDLPAITHLDYSARVQTVAKDTNPRYWRVISAFKQLTTYGVVVNTSFNVRGEPIVCTPEDAYRCFMRTEMDFLVMDDFLFSKVDQPELQEDDNWRTDFALD
jgi:carbamoyltransferase